jgi:5-methylcytosine-specific restriction enzyme A
MAPYRPRKPCNYPGCGALVHGGERYCEQHKKAVQKQLDERRGTATERGYGARWHRASRMYLAEHPLCVLCEKEEGRAIAATIVDHIIPHKGDQELFWNEDNWQSVCVHHHAMKAREDGRWGAR